ncbi:MAG TPA: hypothetical protein GXZ23_02275 [Clostridiales bacterium]|nr:hypothetical protein [Clostridiales bacterium]
MKILTKTLNSIIKLSSFGKENIDKPKTKIYGSNEKIGNGFFVGFGKCDIIPPKDINEHKYYIAGYDDNNPATAVLDYQTASALWIDNGITKMILVSVDVVGILNKDVLNIRKRLKSFCNKTGCQSINICATHNHAGIDTMGIWGKIPKTGLDREFMETLYNAIINACESAYKNRKSSDIYYGKIEVPDMQEDIRTPVVYSKDLHRFRIVPKDGSREVYLLNFASHSESLGGKNSHISADFPCYLRREILNKAGAETIYFVGAIGGMISMKADGKTFADKVYDTMAIGRKLADYALNIQNEVKLKARLKIVRKEVYFDCENTVLMLAGILDLLNVKRYKSKYSSLGYLLKSEISLIEIDNIKCLLLPCEIFPELVYGGYLDKENSATGKNSTANPKPLKEILNDDHLIIFGLANDEVGYVIPPNDFLLDKKAPYINDGRDKFNRKHYEETNSLGKNTAHTIANAVDAIAKE